MPTAYQEPDETAESASQEIDSKYRLIILAAKRSKQLQRGARPRIDIDPTKHKFTRIALEEVIQGKVPFYHTIDGERALGVDADSRPASQRSRLISAPALQASLRSAASIVLLDGLEGGPVIDVPAAPVIKPKRPKR